MLSVWLIISSMLYSLRLSNGGSFPKPLTAREEREYLQRAAQGDLEARNVLIERNLRLVAHIMKKYYTQTSDQEDLISIGTIGLIKGISTFDPKKGARLATYAARCVENAMHPPGRYFPLRSAKRDRCASSDPIFVLATQHNCSWVSPDIFSPIHRFEKFEVHKVHLHFSNLVSTKNISPNALAKSCGAALCFRKRSQHGIQQRSLLLRRRRQLWQQLLKQSGMHLRHAARQKRLRLVRPEHANAKFPFHTIPPRASYAGAAGLIPAASRRAPRAPRRAPLQTSGAGAWLPAAGGPSCRWQWPD